MTKRKGKLLLLTLVIVVLIITTTIVAIPKGKKKKVNKKNIDIMDELNTTIEEQDKSIETITNNDHNNFLNELKNEVKKDEQEEQLKSRITTLNSQNEFLENKIKLLEQQLKEKEELRKKEEEETMKSNTILDEVENASNALFGNKNTKQQKEEEKRGLDYTFGFGKKKYKDLLGGDDVYDYYSYDQPFSKEEEEDIPHEDREEDLEDYEEIKDNPSALLYKKLQKLAETQNPEDIDKQSGKVFIDMKNELESKLREMKNRKKQSHVSNNNDRQSNNKGIRKGEDNKLNLRGINIVD
ncbi:hypothetical protein ABK040_013753 [Willaertia magna]